MNQLIDSFFFLKISVMFLVFKSGSIFQLLQKKIVLIVFNKYLLFSGWFGVVASQAAFPKCVWLALHGCTKGRPCSESHTVGVHTEEVWAHNGT